MPPAQEYKSVRRDFKPREEYEDCGDFLKPFQVEGWELFTVCWVKGVYESTGFEVFYLKRQAAPVAEGNVVSATSSATGAGTT